MTELNSYLDTRGAEWYSMLGLKFADRWSVFSRQQRLDMFGLSMNIILNDVNYVYNYLIKTFSDGDKDFMIVVNDL